VASIGSRGLRAAACTHGAIIAGPAAGRNRPRPFHRKIQQLAASGEKTVVRLTWERGVMTQHPFLIAGGGIAGAAAAIALSRAGIDSVVYEANPTFRDDAGAFFNLAPNGLAVLRALGVSAAIGGLGFRNDRLVFQNERGRVLAETEVGGVTLMRGAMNRALREAAQALGVRFVTGKALDRVDDAGGTVIARFADGTAVPAAAVIGADGIHSRTRAAILPDPPKPAYTGVINLGGLAQTDLPSTGEAMHMIFGSRAFFGYAVRPSGETYWFSNYADRTEPSRDAFVTMDVEAMRDRLLDLHRDDPPEVGRILRAPRGPIGAYPIYDLPPLRAWQRGAICLIGDAAHAIGPHVGQGVSLALEDAYVLATCVREQRDPGAAFAAYEAQRRGRVTPVVRQSRRTGKQKAPSGWLGRQLRDVMLPTFLRMAARGAQELYRWTPPAWPKGEPA
jgi:2-polyprenyl-6-methoxyphenol hydroxylase-like FAD-dependent oxidoreductase